VLVHEDQLMLARAAKGRRTSSGKEVAGAVSVETLDDAVARTVPKLNDVASEPALGVVGFVLAAWTARAALAGVGGTQGTALTRAQINLVAQGASLTGASFDVANAVLKAYSGMRMGAMFAAKSRLISGASKWLTGAGKVLGGFGGLLAGGVTVWQGYDEYQDGHEHLGDADVAAGSLAVLGGIALLAGWTGLGIVVAVAVGLLMLLIGCFKQNPVQNWIEQTPLGDGGLPQFKGAGAAGAGTRPVAKGLTSCTPAGGAISSLKSTDR
jgi:hypothetical protein